MDGYKLSEQGLREFEAVLDTFKKRMVSAVNEAIDGVYVELPMWIETDSWSNLRMHILGGFNDYTRYRGMYDFKQLRALILRDHREEIIDDLNKDHLERIKELEDQLKREREWNRR